MKKQVYECLKEEIIEKILPSDQELARIENMIDHSDSKTRDEYELEHRKVFKYLEIKKRRLENKKRRLVFEILSEYNITEDKKNNLYVLLNYSGSKLLSYFNVETGEVKYIIDNDEEYAFIKNNFIIYPEDYMKLSEKEKEYHIIDRYKKEASKIRYDYYNEAIKSCPGDAKVQMLFKYKKHNENR